MIDGIENWKPDGYSEGGFDYSKVKDGTVLISIDTESLSPAVMFGSKEVHDRYVKLMEERWPK